MKCERIKNLFIFLVPIIAILMQGGFFGYQMIITCGLMCGVVIIDKVKITKRNLILFFLILIGYILCDIINKSFYNAKNEIVRFIILFLPLLILSKETKDRLLKGIYTGISIASFIGVLAFINIIPNYNFAASIDGAFRLQSVFGYANTAAVFCGIGIILAYHYIINFPDYRFVNKTLLCINLLAFVLTFSRLAFACFLASILFCCCIKYKKLTLYALILAIIGVIGVVGLFIIGKENIILGSTFASRLIYWQDGFKLFTQNIFGTGNWQENQFFIQTANYSVKYLHNGFLQIAIDGGILAVISFALLVFSGFKNLLKSKYNLCMICILLFITFHGFVDIDFTFGSIFLILGIVISFGESQSISIKHPFVVIMSVLVMLSSIISPFVENSGEVSKTSYMFSQAYSSNDYENMYILSKRWLEKAPRQQDAYDAYYVSLDHMIKNNSDEKYKYEIDMLYKKVDKVNETMNPLCKYLTAHKEIILPKYKRIQ